MVKLVSFNKNFSMNTPESPVLFELWPTASNDINIGVATLNRPKQLNAITLEMCELLLKQLRQWASDSSIATVVLKGGGEKGFSAGGDVAQVIRHVRSELASGAERFVYGDLFFTVEYELDLLIHKYPKPLISYSHGVCMGGGMGLVAGASHRIVSDRSKIAMPEIHIGLFPDVGGGYFLNRAPGGAGTLMALTGMIINEADALFAELADYFVPQEENDALWAKVKALPWTTHAAANREVLTDCLLSLHRKYHLGLPLSNLRQYYDAIRFITKQSSVEKIRDALVAAAAEDPFFEPMAKNLTQGSPTAAKVTYAYLQRCKSLSIEQVLKLDLVLAKQYQRHHDFPEGVRALLIDKDKKPQWAPATFADVSDELVESHFKS
jgi:enoyl-CoA hydratase/carnithine racemase